MSAMLSAVLFNQSFIRTLLLLQFFLLGVDFHTFISVVFLIPSVLFNCGMFFFSIRCICFCGYCCCFCFLLFLFSYYDLAFL